MLICHCGNDIDEMYHYTKTNDRIKFTDLSDKHLKNIIARINKLAKTGITIGRGDIGYYEEQHLSGKELRKEYNYCCYVTLLESRNKKKDK